jgi:excisionase family DNA binding protein
MRPPRSSSFICPGSAVPRQGAVTLAVGAATRDALARREAHAPAASKSAPQVLLSDLPTSAAATAAAGRRVGSRAKGGIAFPDPDGGNANADDAPLVDGIGSLNKRRAATDRSSRLEPLLTVAQAATILSVPEGTVRRLIASRTIRGIWIGRSVRIRPRDIERWIACGGTCNN